MTGYFRGVSWFCSSVTSLMVFTIAGGAMAPPLPVLGRSVNPIRGADYAYHITTACPTPIFLGLPPPVV